MRNEYAQAKEREAERKSKRDPKHRLPPSRDSIEDLAINNFSHKIKDEFDVLKRGFRAKVVETIQTHSPDGWNDGYDTEEEGVDELKSMLKRVMPDAYMIAVDEQMIAAIEVEDSSKMKRSKLLSYLDLFWEVDIWGWSLRLIVTDRYGETFNELWLPNFTPLQETKNVKTHA